jgi:hypothetical protein
MRAVPLATVTQKVESALTTRNSASGLDVPPPQATALTTSAETIQPRLARKRGDTGQQPIDFFCRCVAGATGAHEPILAVAKLRDDCTRVEIAVRDEHPLRGKRAREYNYTLAARCVRGLETDLKRAKPF